MLGLGLLLRLWHLAETSQSDPFFDRLPVDPKYFHDWGARIASGDWLGSGVFFLSPLYPYFLGVLYTLFGSPNVLLARLVQMLLGATGILLVHSIGKRLFDIRVGLLAALLQALYVMNIFYDGMLLVAPLQAFLNLLGVWLLVRASDSPRARPWLGAGLVLGLSVLARPNTLLFLPVVWGVGLLARRPGMDRRQRLTRLGLYTLGAALCIAPVTARNYWAGHDLVLVSGQSGINLYIGNGPGADGTFRAPKPFLSTRVDHPAEQQTAYRNYAEKTLGRKLSESEVSGFYTDRTLEHVSAHPGQSLLLVLRKLALFVSWYEIANSQDFYLSQQFSSVMRLPLPNARLVFPLALLGLALALRRPRETLPVTGMVLVYAVSLALYFVLAHYRMPVVPFMLLLAAVAVVDLIDLTHQRQLPGLAWRVGGLALLAWLVNTTWVNPQARLFMSHFNLGNRYREAGDLEAARREYESAIQLNHRYISSHNNLGAVCEQLGDRECATRAWRAVRRLGLASHDSAYVERANRHLGGNGR